MMIKVELARAKFNDNGTSTVLYKIIKDNQIVYPPAPSLFEGLLPSGVEYVGRASHYACVNFGSGLWLKEEDTVRNILLKKSQENYEFLLTNESKFSKI